MSNMPNMWHIGVLDFIKYWSYVLDIIVKHDETLSKDFVADGKKLLDRLFALNSL